MGLKITSGTYKTISYKYFKNGDTLIVILPRAGAFFQTHKKLFTSLGKQGSVLFIETGYFGITKPNGNLKEIEIDSFRKFLRELVNRLGYKRIIIIGESVGGVHALYYASKHYNEVALVLLSNPSLYKPSRLYEYLFVPTLKLGLKTSPDSLLITLAKLLKLIPKNNAKQLGNTFLRMNSCISAKSYLHCLEEIVNFQKKYNCKDIKRVLPKTYVIKGAEDKVFDLLCNGEYCKKCGFYTEVPLAGHGLIDHKHGEVVKLIKQAVEPYKTIIDTNHNDGNELNPSV
jgi:pimeloyl-ACP methyl ester carboxylesterase